jgi:CheY-like chemotaxis protein
VLIVDSSDDSREVLRTVLTDRGLRIFEANAAAQGLDLARQHRPDLIVVDLEVDSSSPEQIADEFASVSPPQETPLVVLGNVRRRLPQLPAGNVVRKPYHYGPLVRKIEELLAAALVHCQPCRQV